jgi:hypothetical protein
VDQAPRPARLLSTLTTCNPLSNLESAQVGEFTRLTDDGRVIITTPGAGYAVGDVLYVIGSAASYGIRPSDWVLRLVAGYHSNGGKPWGERVDVRPAYEALLGALAEGNLGDAVTPPAGG